MKDNTIYSTKDYSLFRKLVGNREVLEQRKNVIKKSIVENGYIRNPIVVNENFEIIDGQGRFEALKELGLEVEYVIAYGAGQKECVALNINQKNWKTIDYIKSFSQMGLEEYKFIENMCAMFPDSDPAQIVGICTNIPSSGGQVSKVIKSGNVVFYNKKTIPARLKLYEKIINIIKGDADYGLPRAYASVITFLWECKEIDEQRIVANLVKYKQFISPSYNIKQALKNLEIIYNRCAKKQVYFMPLYDEWLKR